jgi:hypothetical protein
MHAMIHEATFVRGALDDVAPLATTATAATTTDITSITWGQNPEQR